MQCTTPYDVYGMYEAEKAGGSEIGPTCSDWDYKALFTVGSLVVG